MPKRSDNPKDNLPPPVELVAKVKTDYGLSDGSISLLVDDKKLRWSDFERLDVALALPDQTFKERRESKSWLEVMIDRGDSPEMTIGRYGRYTRGFEDISSEQATTRGRVMFAVEYIIELADLVAGHDAPIKTKLVDRSFTADEKTRLRSIYQKDGKNTFRTKDYVAIKIIEDRTKHDVVAPNTWVVVRADQLGFDVGLMRRLTHFGRTSDDSNANVEGYLLTKAFGRWIASVDELLGELESRANKYNDMTCVTETHGQPAQLSTQGNVYATLGKQIRKHLNVFLDGIKIDGKIAGAVGTDVDFKAAFPDVDPQPMYRRIVEDVFGLEYDGTGNDQSSTNANLARALDAMVNVGFEIQKAADDLWLYASRGVWAKRTEAGESGSSAMPAKANPWLGEGASALVSMYASIVTPIKQMLIAYREQGDLRRSITKRELFHPIMLAIIATRRLTEEIRNYEPNVIAIEQEIYDQGPKIISSALQTRLREQGVPDAYDAIKGIVMKPYVRPEEVSRFIGGLVTDGRIKPATGDDLTRLLQSVMKTHNYVERIFATERDDERSDMFVLLNQYNRNDLRRRLIGDAIQNTNTMVAEIADARQRLKPYFN